jgi:hypothetical protein
MTVEDKSTTLRFAVPAYLPPSHTAGGGLTARLLSLSLLLIAALSSCATRIGSQPSPCTSPLRRSLSVRGSSPRKKLNPLPSVKNEQEDGRDKARSPSWDVKVEPSMESDSSDASPPPAKKRKGSLQVKQVLAEFEDEMSCPMYVSSARLWSLDLTN